MERYEQLKSIAERLLERMKLINGDDVKCCLEPSKCPNHSLIHETEAFLKGE